MEMLSFKDWVELIESKDRCYQLAKKKYKVFPSAYASGAIVRCRRGKIWKESAQDKKITRIQPGVYLVQVGNKYFTITREESDRKPGKFHWICWDGIYPRHRNPFEADETLKGAIEFCKLNEDFSLEKEKGLHGWFSRNHGKGWVDCKSSKKGKIVPCGRENNSERKYPACRPTLSQCVKKGISRKKSRKRISWK